MTTDPAVELLRSVISIARTAPGVVAIFGGEQLVRVWSDAPGQAPGEDGADDYPYLEIPTVQIVADPPVAGDLSGGFIIDDPSEGYVDVHALSRQRADGTGGKPEAMALIGACRTVLAREIAVDGFRVTLGEMVSARHFTDRDRLTAHSVATFRYLIQPA